LDDNWQICGHSPKYNYTFHDDDGFPIVNTERFPDMVSMTNHAHSLGLTAGWYLNNCICKDHCGNNARPETDEKCYVGDVGALVEFGFDSVKIDGCSHQSDIDVWARLLSVSGKNVLIENCNNGNARPNDTWCPFNTYRTSGDIHANYGKMIQNLGSTFHYTALNLSRPGCWAFPDMLEVGCKDGNGGKQDPGLSAGENRVHFGAWCVVSSPLTLSHDVNNDTVMDKIWPIIANPEAIQVNQAYAGYAGGPFKNSTDFLTLIADGKDEYQYPTWSYLYKPLAWDGKRVAVLMINSSNSTKSLCLDFKEIPGFDCEKACTVRDIWARKDIGLFNVNFTVDVSSHDAAFIVVSS